MDPIAFEIGPLVFRWYGLLIVGGALFATWVASIEARHRGQDPDHLWDGFIWAFLGGIVGARLYHVLSSPPDSGTGPAYYFREQPFVDLNVLGQQIPFPSALAIWQGGLGIFGGILGGALVIYFYTRRHALHLPTWLDIGAIGLLLGQAIGRWGNYFNQELYGRPTTLPWGISIDAQHRLPEYADLPLSTQFHPTFFYESIWNLIAVGLLLWISRRYAERLRPGDIASLYMVAYGLGRFVVEFQRPDAWTVLGLPTAQWIGLLFVAGGVGTLWLRRRRPQDVPYLVPRRESRAARRRRERQTTR